MITQERLKEVLHYDPETGIFTRILRTGNNNGCKVGKAVGANCHGYLRIGIDYKYYSLHRLVWLYTYGVFPDFFIDHINGIKDDNRLCNLRDVPLKTNAQNYQAAQKNNKSGFLGVYKVRDKWMASIISSRKIIHLGYFTDPILAHEAYLHAKRKFHEGCAI